MRRQSGAVTYMVAVIMLLICTLVTAYTMSDTVLGTLLAANGRRSGQLAATARAGLAEGLARLVDVRPIRPPGFSGVLADRGVYRVRYVWRRKTAPTVLDVIAQGREPGPEAPVRTVVASAVFTPWLADAPPVPVIARGDVRVGGSGVLGRRGATDPLVWSGGRTVAPAWARGRYVDRDPALRGMDDRAWTEATFSMSPERVRDLARPMACTVCDLSAAGTVPRIFMIGGSGRPVTLLTPDARHAPSGPRIAVIDGDLELKSPLLFEGLLFVTGSVVIDHPSVSIRGALVAGGDIVLRAGSVIHSSGTFTTLQGRGWFAPLAGSLHEGAANG